MPQLMEAELEQDAQSEDELGPQELSDVHDREGSARTGLSYMKASLEKVVAQTGNPDLMANHLQPNGL